MSESVRSKYACSRATRYWPSGVANHSASVPVDMLRGIVEDSPMTTIIPIPAFGDNYGCGREYTPANLRFARAVEAADVLLSGAPGRPYVLRRNGVRAR